MSVRIDIAGHCGHALGVDDPSALLRGRAGDDVDDSAITDHHRSIGNDAIRAIDDARVGNHEVLRKADLRGNGYERSDNTSS